MIKAIFVLLSVISYSVHGETVFEKAQAAFQNAKPIKTAELTSPWGFGSGYCVTGENRVGQVTTSPAPEMTSRMMLIASDDLVLGRVVRLNWAGTELSLSDLSSGDLGVVETYPPYNETRTVIVRKPAQGNGAFVAVLSHKYASTTWPYWYDTYAYCWWSAPAH